MAKRKRVYKNPGVATRKSIEENKYGNKNVLFKKKLTPSQEIERRREAANDNLPSSGAFRGLPSKFKKSLLNALAEKDPVARKILEGAETVGDIYAIFGNFKPEQELRKEGIREEMPLNRLNKNQKLGLAKKMIENLPEDSVKRAMYLKALEKRLKI